MKKKICYLLVNFGGPRSLSEVESFLVSLLTDQDVIRTKMPKPLHRILFTRIARKRAKQIVHDYAKIGGKSPIYEDTESIAELLRKQLPGSIHTFHRYLPNTHPSFIEEIKNLDCDEIKVFPLFPQFTYATTGSIARWLNQHLPPSVINKMRWIKSYATHPAFIQSHQNAIKDYLLTNNLEEKETVLLFSAHGVPKLFIEEGDLYQFDCEASYSSIMKGFPTAISKLCYQSKFGPGEWIRPYTNDACEEIENWNENRKHIIFIPLSFTSDHIETLFEVEEQYMPIVRNKGLMAHRVPALTLRADWIKAVEEIIHETNVCNTQMLIRRP